MLRLAAAVVDLPAADPGRDTGGADEGVEIALHIPVAGSRVVVPVRRIQGVAETGAAHPCRTAQKVAALLVAGGWTGVPTHCSPTCTFATEQIGNGRPANRPGIDPAS